MIVDSVLDILSSYLCSESLPQFYVDHRTLFTSLGANSKDSFLDILVHVASDTFVHLRYQWRERLSRLRLIIQISSLS